jgi:hypothetical protein
MNDMTPLRQGSTEGDRPVKRDAALERQLELAREVLREQADVLRELAKR